MPVFRTVTDQQKGSIRLEAVHQPLYDSAIITGAMSISFFQNPANKSALETNLQTAGQLSWPKRFSIRALRQVVEFGRVPFLQMAAYLSSSSVRLAVGEKPYLTLPVFVIPAGVSLETAFVTGANPPTAPTNGQTYANHGRGDQRNVYSLLHSIYLPPVQNFNLSLDIGAAYSSAHNNNNFRVWWFLEGELLREIQ